MRLRNTTIFAYARAFSFHRILLSLITLVFGHYASATGHSPHVFYNVPNWYSSGYNYIRYPSPEAAFTSEWHAKTTNQTCANDGLDWYIFQYITLDHETGYEDGDFWYAWYKLHDYSNDGRTCYVDSGGPYRLGSNARRYAFCSDSGPFQYSPNSFPAGVCPQVNPDPDKNRGKPKCPCDAKGDPLNPSTGNKFELTTVFRGAGAFPLEFTIAYNSMYHDSSTLAKSELVLGSRRQHNYQRSVRLSTSSTTTTAWALRPDGKIFGFDKAGTAWVADLDVNDDLVATYAGDGSIAGWTYQSENGDVESYDASGRLSLITQRGGLVQQLSYNAAGQLDHVTDPTGRTLSFHYDSSGRIDIITAPDSSTYGIGYGANNMLSTVTYPDTKIVQFIHGENNGTTNLASPTDLTGVIDERNKRIDTTFYNAADQAYSNVGAVGSSPVTASYTYQANGSITYAVTEPWGATDTITTQYLYGIPRPKTVTRSYTGYNPASKSYTYDAAGYLATATDFNGITTCYTFDDAFGLETSRTEGVANNPTCTAPVSGTRTIQTDWDGVARVPTERRTYNQNDGLEARTAWFYNGRGQPLARCEYDPGNSVAMGYTCKDTVAPPVDAKVRRWTYTYCDSIGSSCPLIGLLLSVDGPRTDVSDLTTYSYYTSTSGCASGSDCYYAGDLQTVTNALNQVTTYLSYDKNGRITRLKDANGTYTDVTYYPRGWLHTRIIRAGNNGQPDPGDATTTYFYDEVGNLTKVAEPDGPYLTYGYDDAHRLTDVTDALGNHIHYTLDASGNRTGEDTYDPSNPNVPTRTLSRIYDHLNHLQYVKNAAGAIVQAFKNPQDSPLSGVVYNNGYDGDGNEIYSEDGNGVGTEKQYDPLNRLHKSLQDHSGTGATRDTLTQYDYDARNNLVGVADPDGLQTSYTHDGLNLTNLSSPDTGNTSYAYDEAGNRATQTDARNITATYSYDALNRLTGISYPTILLNVTYAYDQPDTTTGCAGSSPKGRLTRITDQSGSTTFCYDRRGNVLKKTQVTKQPTGSSTVTLATSYTYTLADRLWTITYPSLAFVTYGRDVAGRVNSISYQPNGGASTAVVNTTTYYPFGPANVMTFGNNRTLTKTFDKDYAIDNVFSSNTAGGLVVDATVDVLGNLSNASSSLGANPPTQQYFYDPLYRLTSVQDGSGTSLLDVTYGPTGDRLGKSVQGQSTQAYAYTPGTHRLSSVAGVARSYDFAGNTTAQQAGQYPTLAYDDRDRLSAALLANQPGGLVCDPDGEVCSYQPGYIVTEYYRYNGRGERVSKYQQQISGINSIYTGKIFFSYNEAGALLGDYTSLGAAQNEYIYLDGLPVAVASAGTLYYIETDQLGTSREVIRPGVPTSNDAVVWKWDYFAANSAFGENTPSVQTITLNLRFPGQYYDAETGLSYNYFRDYEPGTGRYVESDPVGLKGGLSTYGYVSQRPLRFVDPLGLWCVPFPDETTDWSTKKVADPSGTVQPWASVPPGIGGCIFIDAWHVYQERERRSKSFCRECLPTDTQCPNKGETCEWVWKYGLWKEERRDFYENIWVRGYVTATYNNVCVTCRNPFTGNEIMSCEE